MITGKKHGDLANRIAEEIKARRRLEAGIDKEGYKAQMPPSYTFRPKELLRQQELDGGIVIVGRPTWKEFMTGLKRGWTESPITVDQDEVLARTLENDGRFDELPLVEEGSDVAPSPPYVPLRQSLVPPLPEDPNMPETIPILPPILFVSFTDYIGIKLIPKMIYDFFNQRHLVRSGASAAYQLVMKQTRPFNPPSQNEVTDVSARPVSDLDFDKHSEGYYKKSLDSAESDIDKARKKYYEELAKKLGVARELSSGVREPTKAEVENPPPTEVELSAERMAKEKRWRSMLVGWDIVKPSAEVAWDRRFEGILRVFKDPEEGVGDSKTD